MSSEFIIGANVIHDVVGHDATGSNEPHLPPGQAAGYTTGSDGIAWSSAQWARHPGAVRICQDSGSDATADIIDDESGAATNANVAAWVPKAQAAFHAAKRPGQRWPGAYTSASNVTPLVNELIAVGITRDVPLYIANWSLSEQAAIQDVQDAAGPFPIVAVQWSNGPLFDYDVFSSAWLGNVSGHFAHNPVSGLRVTRVGWTSVSLAWNADPNATSYSVSVINTLGELKTKAVVTSPSVRIGHLMMRHEYDFVVRAHPGASLGTDASVRVTTR